MNVKSQRESKDENHLLQTNLCYFTIPWLMAYAIEEDWQKREKEMNQKSGRRKK